MIITIIQAIPNMDTRGISFSSHVARLSRYLLNTMPAPIGMITILVMSHIMLSTSIFMNAPPKSFMSSGVKNGASMVDTAVMVIDNAKFALARKEITFEAIPFGEQPIRMIPAAISGGKPLNLASVKPSKGIIIKWLPTPINTPFGIFITPAKSLSPIDVPMPNIITCKSGVIRPESL